MKQKSKRRARAPKRLVGVRAAFTPPTDTAAQNLQKIDHIVVLMLENRSYDHMLGYLTLEGGREDLDGLKGGMANPDVAGVPHPVYPLIDPSFDEDPCHEGHCVDAQMAGDNQGFVKDFQKHFPRAGAGKIMGYYNAEMLPTYDHLAREYIVCDRWFACVPGQTWPNRLYSLSGMAAGSRDNRRIPIYSNKSFARHLEKQGVSWRWYIHDFNTLRLCDSKYRLARNPRFRWFEEFGSRVAKGELDAVTWIDPNFVVTNATNSNDDHPPADIRDGQRLARNVYEAVSSGPKWNKTLLIITYDEHGGFFDHVPPPAAEDDKREFRRYGCRVPAIVVSPWVERGTASHVVYDHTSIIKTILLRFCPGLDPGVLGKRTASANHLGGMLTEEKPRAPRAMSATARGLLRVAPMRALRAPALPPRTDLQRSLIEAEKKLKEMGAK